MKARVSALIACLAIACTSEDLDGLVGADAGAMDAAAPDATTRDAEPRDAVSADADAAIDTGIDAGRDMGVDDAGIDAGSDVGSGEPFERVSESSIGMEPNGETTNGFLNFDGRYVAFDSSSSNLVANDTNWTFDVFVRDRELGITTRVSVASNGTQGNMGSHALDISGDGRFVVFSSQASNLVAGDTNSNPDVFVHDRATGVTTLENVDSNGVQGIQSSLLGTISDDGRYLAFTSGAHFDPFDTNETDDVFLRDRLTGETTRIVDGNGATIHGRISGDGNVVAMISWADNLVPFDTNRYADVFVYERLTGAISRVSTSSAGVEGNGECDTNLSISFDGRFIAYSSQATNLVPGDDNLARDVFVYDRQTNTVTREAAGNRDSRLPSISEDGSRLSFSAIASNFVDSDFNSTGDIFVCDRQAGRIIAITSDQETPFAFIDFFWNHSLSGDGRIVAFSTPSSFVPNDTNDHLDAFVADLDLLPEKSSRLSCANMTSSGVLGNGATADVALSADGQVVAFTSEATNFDPQDTNNRSDVIVRELASGIAVRASVDSNGVEGNGDSRAAGLSADGRFVLFTSSATNLVAGDNNGVSDLFLHDRVSGSTTRVSVDTNGLEANAPVTGLISDDGAFVVLSSAASNLVANDNNGANDVFVRDVVAGTTERISAGTLASYPLAIYGGGRYVVFVDFDDAYVRDRSLGTTTILGSAGSGNTTESAAAAEGGHFLFEVMGDIYREGDNIVSMSSSRQAANGASRRPRISGDGQYAVFESRAANLVYGSLLPATPFFETFVCNAWDAMNTCFELSVAVDGAGADADVAFSTISQDGRVIAFHTNATNLPACNGGPYLAGNPFLR